MDAANAFRVFAAFSRDLCRIAKFFANFMAAIGGMW